MDTELCLFWSKEFESIVFEPNENQKSYASIPYFCAYSDSLSKELLVLLMELVPHNDFVLAQVNRHKFESLVKNKEKLPASLSSSLVHNLDVEN